MSGKGKIPDVRHPKIVSYFEGLSAAEAEGHPPIVLERDGGHMRYWLEDGKVRSCEVIEPGRAPEGPPGLAPVLERARAEFGELLPRAAKDLDSAAPDLDAVERAVRDSSRCSGAAALKALLESLDARLPVPDCPDCGARMERHRRAAKTFASRLGEVVVVRSYCRCRDCGGGHHPLDRALGMEGESCTPGAASIIADAVSDSSYEEASRKLENLAGVSLHSSRLKRAALRIGGQVRSFERQEVYAAAEPAAGRMYLAMDGTGVPVRTEEAEGVRGKGGDGKAKTREAKIVQIYTAGETSPKTGEPRKDAGSETVSCQIDSAAAVGGISRRSEFAGRLEREADRAGLRDALELVVISDGAGWIRNVCEELFPGPGTTHILDFWHAADYAASAAKAVHPADKRKRRALLEWIKSELGAGRVDQVIEAVKPHRRLEAVNDCVTYYENNRDRMRYNSYRSRGLQIGSGVVESACRHTVGNRMKRTGSRWTVRGANAVLAIKCCLKNLRWADFLDWKVRLAEPV